MLHNSGRVRFASRYVLWMVCLSRPFTQKQNKIWQEVRGVVNTQLLATPFDTSPMILPSVPIYAQAK